ncbi:MAG: DUF58 domain-containing protein [Betaproteobacteria bacterium]|nr:DUF58 domain-containing protein [Betaproteobacteria bacterium]
MLANLRQRVSDWIFRARVPEAPPVTLVQRRIFILPTKQGYLFAGVLLVLLLASINYALSLGFLLTFLLAAMGSVAMLHTWRNLSQLKLRPGRCDAVFAGDTAYFRVVLESPSRDRFAVAIRRRGESPVFADVRASEPRIASLAVPARRRGRLACGRLEIFTRYPVGLFHAWSYFDFGLSVIVYPRPDPMAGLPPQQSLAGDDEGVPIAGDEDFAQLRGYNPGDPPRQIAWKALARGGDLLTKEFHATASAELWLDWIDARAADPEARLSVLAHWVIETERLGQSYGLRLPGVSIPPGRGDVHRARCLVALALHGEGSAS